MEALLRGIAVRSVEIDRPFDTIVVPLPWEGTQLPRAPLDPISATALGLMQVMPFWVPELGYKDKNQLFDIETNVLLGCQILKYYLDMERGDRVRGLARYNGSVGKSWYPDRVQQRLAAKWFRL